MSNTQERFDFSKLPRPRGSYARTLQNYRDGYLSLGALWILAGRDEVFAAYLKRNKVEQLRPDE
ncbi:hypothetical protein RFM23_05295 [Mesorhizobium abyssinicae]|uniref:Uncharacterized protein n=1 Tax=Mesorhizobium abyssinicae TaxID=1209958 RepID=A0ABU5AID9_9HYPH|nr:hypothetical protein [Mesorhizobium abyssinicae]MDX8537037.1 hypothetical protein [Mesorhizobium abyssinicae]